MDGFFVIGITVLGQYRIYRENQSVDTFQYPLPNTQYHNTLLPIDILIS